MRGIPVFGPYAPIPMWSGRSASAGSRRIHGLSPSTSNEIIAAHRAPFGHLIDCSIHGLLCARHPDQHLGVGTHALAQVLERHALVVAVDALHLGLFDE